MKTINLFICFILFCVCYACSQLNYEESDYEKMADTITEATARKLKKKKQLYLVGTGGRMMHDVQMMAMSFYLYSEIDLSTARELIVYAINEYLLNINENSNIKPYLCKHPFTVKNIEILIWPRKLNGSDPNINNIYFISATDGILSYYINLPDDTLKIIHTETFAEAQRITLLDSNVKE